MTRRKNLHTGNFDEDNEGVEVDLESQVRPLGSTMRTASKRSETNLAVVPLSAAFFSTSAIRNEMEDASETDSESSDSSSDEGNRAIQGVGVISSKSRSIIQDSHEPNKVNSRKEMKVGKERTRNVDIYDDKHFLWFSHGKFWTVIGIFFAWTGLVCANQAKNTTRFVTVDYPIYVDTTFEEVYDVGLINFQLCFNETKTYLSGCSVHELEVSDINDTMFQLARSMAFIATLLGGFLAACITVSIVWQSINLRPVGMGFLLSYFFQSFTFLFFDSQLCAVHKCHLSDGAINSLIASFCWIFACVCAARMDAFKHRQKEEMENKMKRHKKPSKYDRGISDVTQGTESSHESGIALDPERVENRTNEPQLSLICGIEDRRATKAWDARISRVDIPRARDEVLRRERSLSTKRSRQHSSRRTRGNSIEPVVSTRSFVNGTKGNSMEPIIPTRSISVSRGTSKFQTVLDVPGHTTSMQAHQQMRPSRTVAYDSPGRRAILVHSPPKRSRAIDTRTFEL